MTATPALSDSLIGRTQKRISDALYLDSKESWAIHRELEIFASELLKQYDAMREEKAEKEVTFHVFNDPGDEQS